MNGNRARVLLKARPTEAQLQDRLAAPWPDGLEFYLDRQDIVADDWLDQILGRLAGHTVPAGFVWVVEGPLRSLDGQFFDISRNTEGNRETLRRLTRFGAAIGASAAVIHAIAPTEDASTFSDEEHAAILERSLPLVTLYRDLCQAAGLIPTLENIPPVAQMREGRFMHSVIGMEPRDLVELARAVPGLRATIDVSHAQLYLNAVAIGTTDVSAEWLHLVAHIQRRATVHDIVEYVGALDDLLIEAHISNASGLVGEGQMYGDGDLAMDDVIRFLSQKVEFLVTETLEPNPDRATGMREAQRRMQAVLNEDKQ